MMRFIKNPNLPDGRVSKIICGEIPSESEAFFKERDIDILKCQPNTLIDSAISTHADICALHLGENKIVVDKNQNILAEKLRNLDFKVVETGENIVGEYPCDVKLNVALFGKNAVGAFDYNDSAVIDNINDFNKFKVRQGYAKCSLLPVNENAVITDDASIYKTLKKAFDVLLIDKGDIVLDGHEYGFIGGSAGKISKNEIYFFGDISNHRNCKEILEFLSKYSCSAVFPKNVPLIDVGGIVSLCEII